MENNTWELVELPEGRKAIGCKWVFRVKYDGNGEVKRFKGRLSAQGLSQKYGINYEETFFCQILSNLHHVTGICCSKRNASTPDGCNYSIP